MSKIHEAAARGDVAAVTGLLQGGFLRRSADVEGRDQQGMTALHHAARYGHIEVVRLLCGRGAHVDAEDDVGTTPLASAGSWGHTDVVRFLCENGADVNARNSLAQAPLHWVCSEPIAKFLVERGAKVDARDDDGRAPLHNCALLGRPKVMGVLLGSGADVDARDKRDTTPLHVAVRALDFGPVPDFSRYADYDPRDATTTDASRIVRINVITLLLEHAANVQLRDGEGNTPLQMARQLREIGKIEVERLLRERGASD